MREVTSVGDGGFGDWGRPEVRITSYIRSRAATARASDMGKVHMKTIIG